MAMDLFSVAGKAIIVTGGLGQLGRQFTRTLLDRGAKVGVFDVQADPARPPFGGKYGEETLRLFRVDQTKKDSIAAAVDGFVEAWGAQIGRAHV